MKYRPAPQPELPIDSPHRDGLEVQFLLCWQRLNDPGFGPVLPGLLSRQPSEAEVKATESAIAWLGSPAGLGFLYGVFNRCGRKQELIKKALRGYTLDERRQLLEEVCVEICTKGIE